MAAAPLVVTFIRPSGQIGVVVSDIANSDVLKNVKPSDLKNKTYSEATAILAEKEGLLPKLNHQGSGDSVTYTFLPE